MAEEDMVSFHYSGSLVGGRGVLLDAEALSRGVRRGESQRQERARRLRRIDWAFGLSGVGFRRVPGVGGTRWSRIVVVLGLIRKELDSVERDTHVPGGRISLRMGRSATYRMTYERRRTMRTG